MSSHDVPLIRRTIAAATLVLSGAGVSACGDDDHAPVSPVPIGRDAATDVDLGDTPPPPPMDDMGTPPPIEDMGMPPPIEDMGGPPPIDMSTPPPPPPMDMGGPPPPIDMGPMDAGPTRPADSGVAISRVVLYHSCSPITGNPTLVLELSSEPPGSCEAAAGAQLGFSIEMNLPVEAPETFTGTALTGLLCDDSGGCRTGAASVTFDTYENMLTGTGTYSLTFGLDEIRGEFDAAWCPPVLDICGG